MNVGSAYAVMGIGGLFIRSPDPDALAQWYEDVLGVGAGCAAEGEPTEWSWRVAAGDVVFQPFRQDSDYFAADKAFMLNLRVRGIADLVDALKSRGVPVEQRDEWDQAGIGRFARIHDVDGNPIELWEPPGG